MRILLAVHAFPPRSTAGVEVYVLRQAQALQGLGHEVRVLSAAHDLGAEPGCLRRRAHCGVDVVEVVNNHAAGTLAATYDDPLMTASVHRVVEDYGPEGVHVHHLLNLSAGLIASARGVGAPVLLTLHDYWLSCPRDGLRMRADTQLCESLDHEVCAECLRESPYLTPPLQRGAAGAVRHLGLGRLLHRIHDLAPRFAESLLGLGRRLSQDRAEDLALGMDRRAASLRGALEQVEVVLAPTAFIADRTRELGLAEDRIVLSRYGAIAEPTRPRPARQRKRFAFIGTLAPHKGVHVLIEAFRGLPGPDLSLEVCGSESVFPGHARQLREMASGDERIRFSGPFEEGAQQQQLESCDVVVVPSIWWENSPLTILESLAQGVPVVASRIGGVPELIDEDRSGLLVPPRDAGALRAALLDVAEGRRLHDALPALPLRSCRDAAREVVERLGEARA